MWVYAGPTLSHEMRLNPQKLQGHCAFCVSMVLRSPFRTKCVLIAKTEVKLRLFAFGRFCVDALALIALKKQ